MQEQMKRQEEERRRHEENERKKLEIELQRKLAFEQWQNNVEKEKEMEQEQSKPHTVTTANPVSADEPTVNNPPTVEVHDKIHPILGKQLAALSYKRIHLMSATTLASLPVYEKQRAYRHDRAQLMAKDKKKTLWMGIPGVISLMEDESGKLSILDGQHRVGMMALLEEEQRKINAMMENEQINGSESLNKEFELASLDLQNVLVEVFPQRPRDESVLATDKDLDDKAAIFTEINKAEPIKLLDLPGVASKQTRNIIDHAGKNHLFIIM
jgi:hypothetical protein